MTAVAVIGNTAATSDRMEFAEQALLGSRSD